jgi:microcystin-dependent protein
MAASSIGFSGQGAPHENMMPFQCINYIISLEQNFDDTPYICEIRPFAFGNIPKGWGPCTGATLAIQQNTALFALIGVTYGGNGVSTFMLPNLVGQVPVGAGQGPGLSQRFLGQTGGVEAVTLSLSQLGPHNHLANCATIAGNQPDPSNNFWGPDGEGLTAYAAGAQTAMAANAIGMAGGASAHENRQPFVAVSYCIALNGIFPPRN